MFWRNGKRTMKENQQYISMYFVVVSLIIQSLIRVSRILEDDHYTLCHSGCDSVKNTHSSTAIIVEHGSKFAALHR